VAEAADWIVFGPGEGNTLNTRLHQSVTLEWGEGFGSLFRNAAILAPLVGEAASEKSLNWERRIDALERRAQARQVKPRILYLARSGGSAGPGTFVDAAIKAAGGKNVLKTPGWITPDPELLIALEPDLIVTSFIDGGYESVQATAIRHKVVKRYIAARPQLHVPGKLWPCAGPGFISAAEMIADKIDTLPGPESGS